MTRIRIVLLTLIAWLSMLGFDFILHAGVLAELYLRPDPFLLPPARAFALIPVGYLSFLVLAAMLAWLMVRLESSGWRRGAVFGLQLGALIWGAFALGLLSISTASPLLLAGWFVGQTLELALAGAVLGAGLAGMRLRPLFLLVLAFVLVAAAVTIALQSFGVVATPRAE